MTNESVPACACCGGTRLTTLPAFEAAFVARYALGRPPRPAQCHVCLSCGFRSFRDGYSSAQADRLYREYRGAGYVAARRRAEPWYSQRINDRIGASPEEIERRRARVVKLLGAAVPLDSVQTVIDYGGDRGQFIPPDLGSERFVVEVSNALPVPGVTRLEPTDARQADLVLCCHVLEHATAPDVALAQLVARHLKVDGTIYIEVPVERYDLRFVPSTGRARRLYEGYLRSVARSRLAYTAVDFYSTAARLKFNVVPPLGFFKKHEHINFFAAESLSALMRRSGLEVITSSMVPDSEGKVFSQVLVGIGRKTTAAQSLVEPTVL